METTVKTLKYKNLHFSKIDQTRSDSYFEKGCRNKCTRQSQKVLRVVLSSLFVKEIWKNGTWGHGHMFASGKGKHHK